MLPVLVTEGDLNPSSEGAVELPESKSQQSTLLVVTLSKLSLPKYKQYLI